MAEEVEKINPDLVAHDAEDKRYTVHCEAVDAMLLNEFLKEHRQVETLEASAVQQQKNLQSTTAEQQQKIEARTAILKSRHCKSRR